MFSAIYKSRFFTPVMTAWAVVLFQFGGVCRTHAQAAIPAPPPASPISFANDLHEIFMRSCAQCHAGGRDKGGFRMDTRDLFMTSGDTGPALIPGKSAESYLVKLVSGEVEGLLMPMKGPRLSEDEIALIRRWIDEGANWDLSDVPAPDSYIAPLKPRMPELPQTDASITHPVDKILDAYFRANNITPAPPVGDAVFARRATLDLTGLLPQLKTVDKFEHQSGDEKHAKLIEKLLRNDQRYAEHWMTFWNDALRNDFAGTGYIDGGRKQITGWLYDALVNNKRYDEFVRELVTEKSGAEGFVKGIVWRGVTNASMTPAMQAAQNISQVFMGTNLKCASCHDSFVNNWKLKDSYGFAAIFSEEPLELVRCDVPQGEIAEMRFLFPELGTITPTKTRAQRLEELAAAITSPDNGRLTRTIVNRLWARLMGRGIVEPLDDMAQRPWSEDLLDWLAADFTANGYDIKHTIRVIATSRAYQMPAVGGKEVADKDYVFTGPVVRRMGAEQFVDALSCLTETWQGAPAARLDLNPGKISRGEARIQNRASEMIAGAQWIWTRVGSDAGAPEGTSYFRRDFKLEGLDGKPVSKASVYVAADNKFVLYVNGNQIGEGSDWTKPGAFDISGHLREGRNAIAIEANNTQEGPAGLIAIVRIRHKGEDINLSTNALWSGTEMNFNNWNKPEFVPFEWGSALAVAGIEGSPWLVEKRMGDAIAANLGLAKTRSWQVTADPLMRALGRPNREQVTTRRQSVATTLEALELTNGATLSNMLKEGAARLIRETRKQARENETRLADELVEDVYRHAIGRPPTAQEREVALAEVGEALAPEGVEDFLWSVLMSPEFQLIY